MKTMFLFISMKTEGERHGSKLNPFMCYFQKGFSLGVIVNYHFSFLLEVGHKR